ncbi:hypothetical protein PGT21_013215 [Puccinia graminis f. sp. tritici]|uniref:RRM domain-containing protein n=1 Tax=Puccinia graminis f. sp. tritici TaxID=56615 RepID=A0A5B0PFK2_PUCGR|nr:hypothetical protein PGT21_013215 [Puccinia graminis f. sp. tritici]
MSWKEPDNSSHGDYYRTLKIQIDYSTEPPEVKQIVGMMEMTMWNIMLVMDQATCTSCVYAFVHFPTVKAALKALSSIHGNLFPNGFEIGSKVIRVSLANRYFFEMYQQTLLMVNPKPPSPSIHLRSTVNPEVVTGSPDSQDLLTRQAESYLFHK